jgi:hypothetical protein
VIPVDSGNGYQLLTLLLGEGEKTSERVLASVAFVPLRGRFGVRP